ncbi:MAG: beta-L-arabinofuranosidase domain-containing protein [Bacteroidota bacterium]
MKIAIGNDHGAYEIKLGFLLVSLFLLLGLAAQGQIKTPGLLVTDELSPNVLANSHIDGFLGSRMDSCIQNGVMTVNYGLYSAPFRDHTDDVSPNFKGEFWGKWYTSAMLGYGYQPDPKYKEIIDASLKEILDTQEKDGRISSYSREKTFELWDIWGRKYVILGLVANYEQTGNRKALKAAAGVVDELIKVAGPGKTKLTETGLQVLGSMSATSVLEPVVLVYKYTGDNKYLDFAEFMVSQWSEPNAYTNTGMRLIEDAIAGVPPLQISSPKGYEMMSCFEGVCELYRATGKKLYLDAAVSFGKSLLEREIMIVGSGSSTELWCDGAFRQTQLLEQPMETCVTATWMKFTYQLLRLTGDPLWADQMEITLYNALLGAMNESGNWWAYYSPLMGERIPSPMQVPQCHSSCCVANGPRGLLTVPLWSVMQNETGPVINLYTQGEWRQTLQDGSEVVLMQETSYPEDGRVVITLDQEKDASFTLSLRIPAWSNQTDLRVNGEKVGVTPGTYAKIDRAWSNGDQITLDLDMRGRVLQAPGSITELAVMRGPVVLALDSRVVEPAGYNLWLLPDDTEWEHKDDFGGLKYVLPEQVNESGNERYIELTPVKEKPEGVWMAFEVPFLHKITHFFGHEVKPQVMFDYASAGNGYSEENMFRVWIPQPLFMNDIFPEKTWHILEHGEERPTFPASEIKVIRDRLR